MIQIKIQIQKKKLQNQEELVIDWRRLIHQNGVSSLADYLQTYYLCRFPYLFIGQLELQFTYLSSRLAKCVTSVPSVPPMLPETLLPTLSE